MTKVSSSKKMPKPGNTSDVIKQERSSSKAKKMGSEIDEIFGGKKRKRLEEGNKADSNKQKPDKVFAANNESHDKIKIGKNRKSNSFEENSSANRSCRMRKKTADGLTVYTEEELGFGKADAGGTNLCPFDCDCCF